MKLLSCDGFAWIVLCFAFCSLFFIIFTFSGNKWIIIVLLSIDAFIDTRTNSKISTTNG